MKTIYLDKEEVRNYVKEIKKGVFQLLEYESNAKPLKKAKEENKDIRKQTRAIVRFGISYANMQVNKEKVVGSMLYGEYLEGDENYIVTYGEKEYLVAYYEKILETKYFMNGEEVTKDYLIENGYISNSKPTPNEAHRIQPMLNHILTIGKLTTNE